MQYTPVLNLRIKKHTHEFQILNIIRVFSHSTVQIVYRIFLSSLQWK